MDFIEDFRVGKECTQAGVGAEVDNSASIFDAREILRVCIAEDPPAERDESPRAGFCLFHVSDF